MISWLFCFLNADCDFTVSLSWQTSVINVCRTANGLVIVNNHKLTVNVNDLGDGRSMKDIPCSQAKEKQVICDVDVPLCCLQSWINWFITVHNGHLLPMNLNSEDCSIGVSWISLESREQRNHNDHFKWYFFSVGIKDFVAKSLNNLIFLSHKKLIFDVNVAFSIFDKLFICFMNRCFRLLSADTPIICTSQHLNVCISCIDPSSLFDQQFRNSFFIPRKELIIDLFNQLLPLFWNKLFCCLLHLFSNVPFLHSFIVTLEAL